MFTTGISNEGGISAGSFAGPTYVHAVGSKLIVSDTSNSRVLIWNSLPTLNKQAADVVLGQTTMTTGIKNEGGLSAATLSFPLGIATYAGKLYIADAGNHRVLVWNTIPTTNGQPADVILGQPDALTNGVNTGGRSLSSLLTPRGIAIDQSKLFVADSGNNRVLVWNSLPVTTGVPADILLGQTSESVNDMPRPPTATSLNDPYGISASGGRLFVADMRNSRVLNWESLPTSSQAVPDAVLGQLDFVSTVGHSGQTSESTLRAPSSVFVHGDQLFVADRYNHRGLIWNTMPGQNGGAADVVLGQRNMDERFSSNGVDGGLNQPEAMTTDGNRYFVADTAHHRVLVWNRLPTANSQAADLVLGQPDMNNPSMNNGGLSAQSLRSPGYVFSDGQRLYVADSGNNRVLIWTTLPSTNHQEADLVIGQSDMVTVATDIVESGMDLRLFDPGCIFSDGQRLFIADRRLQRIHIWHNPPAQSGQVADVILGQPIAGTLDTSGDVVSDKTFRTPSGIFFDGTKLFVADRLNHRVLVWDTLPQSAQDGATRVFGQVDMTSRHANSGGLSQTSLKFPMSIYLQGRTLFIADSGNNRVLVVNARDI